MFLFREALKSHLFLQLSSKTYRCLSAKLTQVHFPGFDVVYKKLT